MKKMCILILLAAMGCSNGDLTRENATEILKKDFPRPYVYKVYTAVDQQAKIATESTLEADGLIKIERVQKLSDIGKPLIFFTEKAKPFLLETPKEELEKNIQRVRIADEEFGEITGIKLNGEGTHAVVEYTTSLNNITPFTSLMRTKIAKTTTTNKVRFDLYDDGWRLAKN